MNISVDRQQDTDLSLDQQWALDSLIEREYGQFAIALEAAQTLWITHRDLVESGFFPEHLRRAFVSENGDEPAKPGELDCGSPDSEKDLRKRLLPAALEMAKRWKAQKNNN